MIEIKALANGQWEIHVVLKNKNKIIKRGKICVF